MKFSIKSNIVLKNTADYLCKECFLVQIKTDKSFNLLRFTTYLSYSKTIQYLRYN